MGAQDGHPSFFSFATIKESRFMLSRYADSNWNCNVKEEIIVAWSKKTAIGIGVAMGICATFAAMIPSAHKSEAAIAVIDQRNIEEAAKTAIQTAKILTEEQKKYALMLLQMKKLDAGILQQIAQEEIQKAQERKVLQEGTPQGVIDYHRGVDAVWLERLGDLNGILNGDITVYDEVQKEKVRKRTLDEAYKAGVKQVKQEILDQYDSAEKIAKLEQNMNTAEGEAQMLQILGAGVGEGVSAQNRTNRILAEILAQESQAKAVKMYKEAIEEAKAERAAEENAKNIQTVMSDETQAQMKAATWESVEKERGNPKCNPH